MERPKYIVTLITSYVPTKVFDKEKVGTYLLEREYIEDWDIYTRYETLDEAITAMLKDGCENSYRQATKYGLIGRIWLSDNPDDYMVVEEYAVDEIEYLDNGKWALKGNLRKDRTLSFFKEDASIRIKQDISYILEGLMPRYNSLLISKETPQILQDLGLKNKPIMMSQHHVRNCLHEKGGYIHWHGLSSELIANIPNHLTKPAMVMDSMSDDESVLVVFDEVDDDNLPIMASIKTNGKGVHELKSIDANYLTSVYGKDNFDNFLNRVIDSNFLLYADKEKTQELSSCAKLQLLGAISQKFEFNTIIHKSNNVVNDIEQINDDLDKKMTNKTKSKVKRKVLDEEL